MFRENELDRESAWLIKTRLQVIHLLRMVVNLLGIFRNGASRRRSEPRLRDGVLEIFLPTSTLLAR